MSAPDAKSRPSDSLEHPPFRTVEESEVEMWLEIADNIGRRKGTCTRRNVGAVLIANGRQRESGWNGMERGHLASTCMGGACPRGMLSSEDQPHGVGYSNCVYLHAEFNVAENYRHSGGYRNVEGWATNLNVIIYTSSNPCEDCVTYARWAGITLVWDGGEYLGDKDA